MKQSFFIYSKASRKKKSKKSEKFFYVWFLDPETGERTTGYRRSVDELNVLIGNPPEHIRNRDRAVIIAQKALETGKAYSSKRGKSSNIPETEWKKDGILFSEWVRNFWTFETSPYVKRKTIEGKPPTRSHCSNQLRAFNSHCAPLIDESLPLESFTVGKMEDIKIAMFDRGLSSSTINKAINCIRKPLSEAYRMGYIKENIADRLLSVSVDESTKGILTQEEENALLLHLRETTEPDTYERWKYLFVALSHYTGMRLGEIQALTPSMFEVVDDETTIITVSRAWSDEDKIKGTKNGKTRYTTAPTPLCREILEYSNWNPEGLIFASLAKPSVPINKTTIGEVFREALHAIGIEEEERRQRNITFHSLRHFFNTSLVNSGLDREEVRRVTGHSSDSMTERYLHETREHLLKQSKARNEAIPYAG